MKHLQFFSIALFFCLCTTAFAQPRVGEKVGEFQLQATDGRSYGVNHSNDMVSVLFFVGYNCEICIGAGTDFESQVHQPNSDKAGVQILTLDRYNGNPSQATSYLTQSRVTTPMLLNASDVSRDLGVRNRDILIIDQGGILRLRTTVVAIHYHDLVNAQIDALLNAAQRPIISLVQENLSLGEIEVGKDFTTTFTITNSGTGPLTITDIQSDLAGIAFSETQLTVPPGQSRDITITFNPTAPGPFTGTIDIISDDPEKASISLTITGLADLRTDFNGSGTVDFYDFILFSGAFGTTNATFDLDGSGTVDFPDFLIFVASFGNLNN